MTVSSSSDVFFDQLKDLRSAAEQVWTTLPDLEGWCTNSNLRAALEYEHRLILRHLNQILAIFDGHQKEPGDDVCKAIAGLIEGGNQHLEMAADCLVRDHLLVAHTNRIAHYLVAAAQFTRAIAIKSGLVAELEIISRILASEREHLRKLFRIAAGEFELELGGGD